MSDSLKILLIDDSESDRNLIKRSLQRISIWQFTIYEMATPEQAQAVFKDIIPDIVILDYRMGKISGLEVLQSLRVLGEKTVFIFLTGQGNETLVTEVLQYGADDYLPKQALSPDVLERSIRYALDKHQKELELKEAKQQLETTNQYLVKTNQEILRGLEQAKMTQTILLSQESPSIKGVDFAKRYIAIEQVGGDIYDIFPVRTNQTGIFIADVTGHGVSAALISSMILGIFRNLAFTSNSPKETIEKLNDHLCGKLPEGIFCTSFYGIYEHNTLCFHFTSAGHPPGFVVRPSTQEIFSLATRGMLLGVFSSQEIPYEQSSIQIMPGDKLLLYTDGIIEMTSISTKMFGVNGLKQFLLAHSTLPIEKLLDKIYDKVLGYSQKLDFEDDITLIGVEIIENNQ